MHTFFYFLLLIHDGSNSFIGQVPGPFLYSLIKVFQLCGSSLCLQAWGQPITTVFGRMPPRPLDWIMWLMPSRGFWATMHCTKPFTRSFSIRCFSVWDKERQMKGRKWGMDLNKCEQRKAMLYMAACLCKYFKVVNKTFRLAFLMSLCSSCKTDKNKLPVSWHERKQQWRTI